MATNAKIIVVAPDRGFRRSLEFALEAEGFTVDGRAFLDVAEILLADPTVGCAVIDEEAIEGKGHSWDSLRRLSKPTVLLVSRPQSLQGFPGICIVEKPVVGDTLVEAVRTAIDTERAQVSHE